MCRLFRNAVVIAGSKRIAADHIFMIVVAQLHEVRRLTVGVLRQTVADLHIDALITPDTDKTREAITKEQMRKQYDASGCGSPPSESLFFCPF